MDTSGRDCWKPQSGDLPDLSRSNLPGHPLARFHRRLGCGLPCGPQWNAIRGWEYRSALESCCCLAHPAAVQAGDTIWLRGGTYTIPPGRNILCGLRGTAAAPITVAQYPGERATIDIKGAAQGFFFTNSPNPSGAAYVNFKDFEVTNSDTNRRPECP